MYSEVSFVDGAAQKPVDRYAKLKCKYYNKRITTRDDRNVQFHDQEERKSNSTKGAHTLTHNKIINKIIQDR